MTVTGVLPSAERTIGFPVVGSRSAVFRRLVWVRLPRVSLFTNPGEPSAGSEMPPTTTDVS